MDTGQLAQILVWPIILLIVVLFFLIYFRDSMKKILEELKKTSGKLGPSGIEWALEREQQIDQKLSQNQSKHKEAGEAAKAAKEEKEIISSVERGQNADVDLEKTVTPQELPIVQQMYKQKLIGLVQKFNQNRHDREKYDLDREKVESLIGQGDQIVYEMRSMAPLLVDQIDISAWLKSPDLGKQLAATKYLDWAQDIHFAEDLANRLQVLENKHDTFQTYHVLLALYSMAKQLSYEHRDKIKGVLENYTPSGKDTSSRVYLKKLILEIL